MYGITVIQKDENHVCVKASGGENWHDLVQFCLQHNYGGIENLSFIPGTVGAAPIQNIGAYGVELGDVLVSLKAIDLDTNEEVGFSKTDCNFGYRDSVFKNKYKGKFLITSIIIRLTTNHHSTVTDYPDVKKKLESLLAPPYSIQLISEVIGEIRSSKLPDPAVIGNCGSFFKNAVISEEKFKILCKKYPGIPGHEQPNGQIKVPSGWLIEQCGWKGKSLGRASVYDQHSLILVNLGGASGQEIYLLSEEVIRSVEAKFGIILDREVNIVG